MTQQSGILAKYASQPVVVGLTKPVIYKVTWLKRDFLRVLLKNGL
jgi:hypothetical protein